MLGAETWQGACPARSQTVSLVFSKLPEIGRLLALRADAARTRSIMACRSSPSELKKRRQWPKAITQGGGKAAPEPVGSMALWFLLLVSYCFYMKIINARKICKKT